MKRHLTASRIALYLLYLTIVCMLVFGMTYARYNSAVSGRGTAKVAAVALDLQGDAARLDLTAQLGAMSPGAAKEILFSVTNQKDGIVSEVAQEYSVLLTTTGNLPLTYALSAADVPKNDGDYILDTAEPVSEDTLWMGGRLPCDATGMTHKYKLTVKWPAGKADPAYADEIDQVTLTIEAKQALPETVL